MDTRCWQWIIVGAGADAISIPPGEYDRKVETRELTGARTSRSMWFNSKLREEPYQGLTYRVIGRLFSSSSPIQVVHGCRSAVSWDVRLSPATRRNPYFPSCQHVRWELWLPVINRSGVGRQIIMPFMSNTRTRNGRYREAIQDVEQNSKSVVSVRTVGWNSPTRSRYC